MTRPIPGGINWVEPIPQFAFDLLDEISAAILTKISEKYGNNRASRFQNTNWNLVAYGKQVVAGLNHYFKVSAGNEFIHAVVFQNLRGEKQVTKVDLLTAYRETF